MATSPTLKVEIAFASTPLNTAPTWTDVSQYVRQSPGVSIRRGRQSELDNFDAGHLQLTLDNRDRRFDPSYAAGPNFGNLIPRKQIRVTATWSAVDYVMFTGHIVGWPQTLAPPAGKDATVTIEALSAEAWLANNNLPNDLVYSYANTTIGSLAFFLRGADTASWSDATSNGYTAGVLTGTGATSSSLSKGSSGTAVVFDTATTWSLGKTFTAAGAWSLSFWFQYQSLGPGGSSYLALGVTPTSSSILQIFDSSGQVALQYSTQTTTGSVTSNSANSVTAGVPHHVVLTSDGATAAGYKIYLDGVDRTLSTSGSYQAFFLTQIGSGGLIAAPFSGSIQDVAVFNKQLSAAEVLAFYNRSYGFLAESAATRVTRLLDDVGWPSAWRTLTTTSRATCGELVYNGVSALEKLQEVQRTEQGRIFASKANNVTFLERYYAQEQTVGSTAQQVFSDTPGANDLAYSTFGYQYNDIDITNSAMVTTPTTRASSSDATSITANGLQSKTVDTILSTFAQANSMAAGLVANGKNAVFRVPPIVAYPANNTTRWDEILLLELGQRISVKNTPMGVGAQNVQEQTLEHIEWLIENQLWTAIVGGSPVHDNWFIIGTSLIGSTTNLIGY